MRKKILTPRVRRALNAGFESASFRTIVMASVSGFVCSSLSNQLNLRRPKMIYPFLLSGVFGSILGVYSIKHYSNNLTHSSIFQAVLGCGSSMFTFIFVEYLLLFFDLKTKRQ
ncbi:unnamed protein product [Brachionus calyciflorus]|uniref:Uncharacterized protein n=1 Tax=Brachionus calyciflorus TaxID=104777 RepID=A0A813QXL6_9BILA|nr:unnamed protein product [Brachionus calyciflorus]